MSSVDSEKGGSVSKQRSPRAVVWSQRHRLTVHHASVMAARTTWSARRNKPAAGVTTWRRGEVKDRRFICSSR